MEKIILHSTPIPELRSMIGEILREELRKFKPDNSSPSKTRGEYLSRKEVCELLKISLSTLHYWTKDSILSGYRIGGRVLYKIEEIEGSIHVLQSHKHKHCIR